MGEAVQLRLHGLDDLRMAVAGVHDRDARRKVDIAVAVAVPDLGILGPFGIDLRGHAHATGNGGVLAVGHGRHRNRSLADLADASAAHPRRTGPPLHSPACRAMLGREHAPRIA